MKLSVEEIKAVAEAAIAAKQKVAEAKTTLEAEPENEDLKAALTQAENEAAAAQSKADALSQNPNPAPPDEKKDKARKLKRRKAIIDNQLRELGEGDDEEDDDEEDDLDDPDRPLTIGDLQRIRANESRKTAQEMAKAIENPEHSTAVIEALKRVVPSGNAEEDFKAAVGIANQDRNDRILAEQGRRAAPNQHRSGPGAPTKKDDDDDNISLSKEEEQFTEPPFNLTKKAILAARGK